MNSFSFKTIFTFLFVLLAFSSFGQIIRVTDDSTQIVNQGIGLGAAIAVVISWSKNSSVRWAILHGILSWIYVVYFVYQRDYKKP